MATAVNLCVVVVVTVSVLGVNSANLTQAQNLYDSLFATYNRYMFPVLDLNNTILINSTAIIVSINSFDELTGELEISCAYSMQWTDERLMWVPSEHGETSSLLVPHEMVWHPSLYLMQSYDHIQMIGNISYLLRIYANGSVTWTPANVLKVICSVDVTYFPFDTQTCYINVSTWSYTKNELRFVIMDTEVDKFLLSANSQWEVLSITLTNTSGLDYWLFDGINMKLSLRRRSDFFIVYIITPVVFLGLINNLVFVMPASSGERNSVAITAFLSFIVFMQMVNSNVPESSSPLAYLYYYMLFMLVYSSVILYLSIVSQRIYDKDEEVPERVVKIIKYLRFWKLKSAKKPIRDNNKVMDIINDDMEKEKDGKAFENDDETTESIIEEQQQISWKIIGKTFDKYCGFILFVTNVLCTSLTMTSLYTNGGS